MSYAIVWSDSGGTKFSGRLDLTSAAVVLTGTGAGAAGVMRELSYSDLAGARVERCGQVELPPEPALVLSTRNGERLVIGTLEGVGALYELADDVAVARGKAHTLSDTRLGHSAMAEYPPPPVLSRK
jgi:hypothetical protein